MLTGQGSRGVPTSGAVTIHLGDTLVLSATTASKRRPAGRRQGWLRKQGRLLRGRLLKRGMLRAWASAASR